MNVFTLAVGQPQLLLRNDPIIETIIIDKTFVGNLRDRH